jgi:hypothetical protein
MKSFSMLEQVIRESRDISVGIATGYEMEDQETGLRVSTASRPAPAEWLPVALSEVKTTWHGVVLGQLSTRGNFTYFNRSDGTHGSKHT